MKIKKPLSSEYPVFYFPFIQNVPQEDALEAMRMVHADTQTILGNLTEEQGRFSYGEGKWTIKALVGHMIDCERIYQYRALCVARGEKTALPGFDQDLYVGESNAEERSLESLVQEFGAVRQASIALFSSFTDAMMDRVGNANGYDLSVRSIAFIVSGHEYHHMNVLKEKYLPKL